MKKIFFLLLILSAGIVRAQHCPWDCTGMILLETNISKEQFRKISPRLVDENKKGVVDTIYGTGKDTYDPCEFLDYNDFIKYRAARIALHHWYAYDTLYQFAEGKYIVRYNYCEYKGKKLFIQFMNPNSRALKPMYIEIPDGNRIHLHDYNQQLQDHDAPAIRESIRQAILVIDCKKWAIRNCN